MSQGNTLKNSWRNLALTTSAILLGFMSYQIINDSKLYREKRHFYDQLRNEAIACVRDGNPGLSCQEEIVELYRIAKVNLGVDYLRAGQAELPIIPREKLEEVIKNCESEGKLE